MNRARAVEIIENLRDYAYENWDDETYERELDEIGEAVDFIIEQLTESKIVGNAEINGERYLIYKA